MNDINKMPPKCQYCPYWEICKFPWVCPDIGDEKPKRTKKSAETHACDSISRRLAIDKFAAYIYHAFKDFYRIGLHRKTLTPEQCRRVARNVLAEVPFAQPEIIHCRECKHYYFADNRIPQEQRYVCDIGGEVWQPDDFCSYGERREVNE